MPQLDPDRQEAPAARQAPPVHPLLYPRAQPQGTGDRHQRCRQHQAVRLAKLRISRNRVFEKLAGRGRTASGWFHGFKLHMVINNDGEIMAVRITPGNTDDRAVPGAMTRELEGRILADKGDIPKRLFGLLWSRGLKLITGIRRNMRNHLMSLINKLLLKGRFIIEILFDRLESYMALEHTRHRSPVNAIVHILSCLVACKLGKTRIKMSNLACP